MDFVLGIGAAKPKKFSAFLPSLLDRFKLEENFYF